MTHSLTPEQVKIIYALADNDLVVERAARSLPCHRNTVSYHIRRILEATGRDVRRFYDLREILESLQDNPSVG